MEQIKKIIDDLELKQKKEEFLNNKEFLFWLERKMAEMTFQYEVGWYAHCLDEIDFLKKSLETASPKKKELLERKIELLQLQIQHLETKEEILIYKKTRELYHQIKEENHKYHQMLQKDFRERLRTIETIPYYVSQGCGNKAKHIIHKDEEKEEANVYPQKKLKSKRKYRHFYNKLSFQYLESIMETKDLTIKEKQLKKVKIMNKNC